MPDLKFLRPEGCFQGDVPLSLAVQAGRQIFVSGIPGFDSNGCVAAGDFAAQMTQAMENISRILAMAGAAWDCVTKVNVLLTRRQDFAVMNEVYARYFRNGLYPARTTAIVLGLPNPDFLVEIECQAVIQ
ncbi:RidA family protein [Rhodoplanes sp. Z2-YC6860]|uniref:RidA family protein n=1 Tax=Rhodoplanes sp. Z2-YC6860 TaxID=674703 RepID=UPI00078DD741|nr:RidA family protein [Rhodoplanes sp. Z2-YC6860]AMN42031.1 translation initiation inhibitor, endoribonuclease [Rhodoplanes sp. Z2-YC6860]